MKIIHITDRKYKRHFRRADPAAHRGRGPDDEGRLHVVPIVVTTVLQRESRVTYRRLKHLLGLDDALLAEIKKELTFKQLARDEQGNGLVWTGEEQLTTATPETISTETPSDEPTVTPEPVYITQRQNAANSR